MEEDQEHTYRVVRFEVIPQSIRLEGEWGGVTRGAGLVDGPTLLLQVFSHLIPVIAKRPQCSIWPSHGRVTAFPLEKVGDKGRAGICCVLAWHLTGLPPLATPRYIWLYMRKQKL